MQELPKPLLKRIILLFNKLDQPEIDKIADKLLTCKAINAAYPGMSSDTVLKQIQMNPELTDEKLENISDIIRKYE
jgi:hypothetical protein